MNTAQADQYNAALRDTRTLQATLAAAMIGAGARTQRGYDGDAMTRWHAAEIVHGCSHTRNPTPVLGLLARPGVIYCPRCITATADRHVKRHPHDCDNCGRYSRLLHEVSALAGPVLTVLGHVCPTCLPTPRKDTTR